MPVNAAVNAYITGWGGMGERDCNCVLGDHVEILKPSAIEGNMYWGYMNVTDDDYKEGFVDIHWSIKFKRSPVQPDSKRTRANNVKRFRQGKKTSSST